MPSFYAVYQSGYAIFGVGLTHADAIADAKEWLDESTNLAEIINPGQTRGEVHGALYIRPCTEALAVEVTQFGGNILWDLTEDGTLCLNGEQG